MNTHHPRQGSPMPHQLTVAVRACVVLACLSTACLQAAFAASFDCAKAVTQVEKLICSDPELSKLDDRLGADYKKATDLSRQQRGASLGVDPILIQDQVEWLKSRNTCKDAACIKKSYTTRLFGLRGSIEFRERALNPPPPPTPPTPGKSLYVLEKGKGVEVCEAYGKNLNTPKPRLPYVCGRSVHPELGFSKPDWQQRDLTPAHPNLSNYLWERDVNQARYFRKWSEWKATPAQIKEAREYYNHDREQLRLWRAPIFADFDIDNDGKIDHVIFQHPCGGSGGDVYAVLAEDNETIDKAKTERLTPHPPFREMGGYFRPVKKGDYGTAPVFEEFGYRPTEDPITNVHYDFFLFKGRAYIDQWWSRHPDFKGKSDMEAGRLRVFEPSPTGTREICAYRFEYGG